MKSEELRIGNCLTSEFILDKVNDNRIEVVEILRESIIAIDYDCALLHCIPLDKINPVPLTEDRLLKFGFTSHYGGFNNKIKIEMHDSGRWILVCDDKTVPTPFIDFIHQLQNLYFALTGEELTLK